jgi:4-hydroxybenzoate polyprenyltransferase
MPGLSVNYISIIKHLRIPFSFYLSPIFLLGYFVSPSADIFSAIFVFVIIHFFLYSATNSYNSYFDKDTGSIGSLKNPPPVTKELYWTSLSLDAIAIVAALFVSYTFALMVFIFGLVSKAYSHPLVRLKKYPVVSLFVAAFFQGGFTVLMVSIGLHGTINDEVLFAALLATVMLLGFYPITQIYQHKEDKEHGDLTFSRWIGIRGTFYFAAVAFAITAILFWFYFETYYDLWYFFLFAVMMLPMVVYLGYWYYKVHHLELYADYHHTMKMLNITGICLNMFFIILILI